MEKTTQSLMEFLGDETQMVRKDVVGIKGQLVTLSILPTMQQKLQSLEETFQKINQVQIEFNERVRLLQQKLFLSKSSLASLKS